MKLKYLIAPILFLSGLLSPVFADESDLYDFLWLDPDKKVYVLQNKLFKKKNSFFVDVSLLQGISSSFQNVMGFQGRVGYFFAEEWGVELLYNGYSNSNNVDYDNVRAANPSEPIEPFIRRFNSSIGALVTWAPIYGKMNIYNKIFYFDWSFSGGLGSIDAESNKNTVTLTNVPNRYDAESFGALLLRTDMRFYFTELLHLGIGVQVTSFSAVTDPYKADEKNMTRMTDIIYSVGVSF